jgi:hypothetical protein
VVVVAGVWGSVRVDRWDVRLDDWSGVGWGVRLDDWGRVSVRWGRVGVRWGGVGVWLHGNLVGVSVGGGDWGVVDSWGSDNWGLVGGGHVATVGWSGVGVRGGDVAGVGWGGVAAVSWCSVTAVSWGSVRVASDWGDVTGGGGSQNGGEGDDLGTGEKKGLICNYLVKAIQNEKHILTPVYKTTPQVKWQSHIAYFTSKSLANQLNQ